jgi:hypothetical protein
MKSKLDVNEECFKSGFERTNNLVTTDKRIIYDSTLTGDIYNIYIYIRLKLVTLALLAVLLFYIKRLTHYHKVFSLLLP